MAYLLFTFILQSLLHLSTAQVTCPGCLNSLSCFSGSDCLSTGNYVCKDGLCLEKDVCPEDTCDSSATCLSNGLARYYCYCRNERISSDKHCWPSMSWLPTLIVPLFLFCIPCCCCLACYSCFASTLSFMKPSKHPTRPVREDKEAIQLTQDDFKTSTHKIDVHEPNDPNENAALMGAVPTALVGLPAMKGHQPGMLLPPSQAVTLHPDTQIQQPTGPISSGMTEPKQGVPATVASSSVPPIQGQGEQDALVQGKDRAIPQQLPTKDPPIVAHDDEKPPFFPEPRQDLPSWFPSCCRNRCTRKLVKIPYKLLFSILSIFFDFFSMISTLVLLIQSRSRLTATNDWGYVLIEFNGIVLFFLEVFVTWNLFRQIRRVRPDRNQWCINPEHYKFWLICFYFPNMVALAPVVGASKIWYIVGDTAYSAYFFATGRNISGGSSISKILALIVRIPYAIAQSIIFCIFIYRRYKMKHRVHLTQEEWYQFFAQSMKSWKQNVPNIMNILIAKYKWENQTSVDPSDPKQNMKSGAKEVERGAERGAKEIERGAENLKPQYK
eukprot:TRINITY_DN10119_c0_g1_i1.p1 TRINITY_DN10119_c0_g1~~TRINITY_DN10119_c0_g1_i1.p1  ORF type:complete len:553 (+),score=13.02 TRINITY_DN10119_c0_g1_i1:73-1731(+)